MGVKKKPGEYEVKLRIKKGDEVQIIAGKDKGKSGKVLRAFPKKNKVLVEGVNMIIRHTKAKQTERTTRTGMQEILPGGRIEKPAPMFAPKVMLICPSCRRPTRVGYGFKEGAGKLSSRKFRHCKHPDCAKTID
ncbi:MAG: 50S ribosomal protein L24 [Chthonomonadales bacterium]